MQGNSRVRRRTHRFTTVSTELAHDTRISIEARGMVLVLCSFTENWVFRSSHLRKLMGVGKDKYQRMVRELKEFGYLSIEPVSGGAGRFEGWDWIIEDRPHRKPENPASGKPGQLRNTKFIDNPDVIED